MSGQIRAISLGSVVSVSQPEAGEVRLTLRSTTMETGLGSLVAFTFRLHGGRIISSNADDARGGTAAWHRPTGPIEAVVTPAPEHDLIIPLLVGLGTLMVAGAIGAGILVYRRNWLGRRGRTVRTRHYRS